MYWCGNLQKYRNTPTTYLFHCDVFLLRTDKNKDTIKQTTVQTKCHIKNTTRPNTANTKEGLYVSYYEACIGTTIFRSVFCIDVCVTLCLLITIFMGSFYNGDHKSAASETVFVARFFIQTPSQEDYINCFRFRSKLFFVRSFLFCLSVDIRFYLFLYVLWVLLGRVTAR